MQEDSQCIFAPYAEVKDKQKADEGNESEPEVPQKQLSEDLNEEIPAVPQQNVTTEDIQQMDLSTKVEMYNCCLTSVIVEIPCEQYK